MTELLSIKALSSGHGEALVISNVSLNLMQGRSLALLGRNGVGKTTLVDTIIGVTSYKSGEILLDGKSIARLPPERRALLGVGWVPQERNIFRSLTVLENLTAVAVKGPWNFQRVFEMFPRLGERKNNMGNQLSGGEQQMLAVGRALVLNPKILLLDEPTEGLAPIIIDELLAALRKIFQSEGISGIIIEQHAQKILQMTDDAIILERGSIVHSASSAALLQDAATLDRYLGIGGAAPADTHR